MYLLPSFPFSPENENNKKDDRQITPHILERGVLGDEGWSIEISNPIVERGTSSTSTGMVAPSNAQRLQEDEGDQGTSIS